MAKRIPLDVLTNWCNLDTVIAELERLREIHGGKSMVDITMEPVAYEDRDEILAELEVYDSE